MFKLSKSHLFRGLSLSEILCGSFLLTTTYLTFLYHFRGLTFTDGVSVPIINPIGIDFRAVHEWSQSLFKNPTNFFSAQTNVYPIFSAILFWPFTLLSPFLGYRIAVVLSIVSLFLTVSVLFIQDRSRSLKANLTWIFLVCVFLFQTYPVLFCLERGNLDIIIGFLMALSIRYYLRDRYGLSALLLMLATQIKVYPIMFSFLFLAGRKWKAVAYYGLFNVLALFVVGVNGFNYTVAGIVLVKNQPYLWEGNHSIFSFFHFLNSSRFNWITPNFLPLSQAIVVLYLLGVLYLTALGYWNSNAKRIIPNIQVFFLGLVGYSFTLMSLVPNLSHDYRLVVQIIPFIMLCSSCHCHEFLKSAERQSWGVVVGVSLGYLFAPRVTLNHVPKTPALIVLSIAYFWLAARAMKQPSTLNTLAVS